MRNGKTYVVAIVDRTQNSRLHNRGIGHMLGTLIKRRISPELEIEVIKSLVELNQVLELVMEDPDYRLFLVILDWPVWHYYTTEPPPVDPAEKDQDERIARAMAAEEAQATANYLWDRQLATKLLQNFVWSNESLENIDRFMQPMDAYQLAKGMAERSGEEFRLPFRFFSKLGEGASIPQLLEAAGRFFQTLK